MNPNDDDDAKLPPRLLDITALAELLASSRHALHEQLADPAPRLLAIVDPRPHIRATGTIQNTYALSMLQAETLAALTRLGHPVRRRGERP